MTPSAHPVTYQARLYLRIAAHGNPVIPVRGRVAVALGTTLAYHAAPISIVSPSPIDLSRRPRGLLEAASQGTAILRRVG